MEQDPAYRKDYEHILGVPAGAVVGEPAARIVNAGLKQLFDDYKEGVSYLRQLAQKKK